MWLRGHMRKCGLEGRILQVRRNHREPKVQQFRGHLAWCKINEAWCEPLQYCLSSEQRNINEHLPILGLVLEFDRENIYLSRPSSAGRPVNNLDSETSHRLSRT
ncbi:hypothetical protein AU184_22740 [Mycolicibacterium novocastrense]|nr:hypothetical protein AU072_24810 [Mycolicibacterium novocastrense]KUH68322.1 hypothetical protein AU184_22740 [Mycolicibacterium novocastrense]KUH73401.1 hypothetical protein AU183_23630 [Mycolicibacterium novocastrense]